MLGYGARAYGPVKVKYSYFKYCIKTLKLEMLKSDNYLDPLNQLQRYCRALVQLLYFIRAYIRDGILESVFILI